MKGHLMRRLASLSFAVLAIVVGLTGCDDQPNRPETSPQRSAAPPGKSTPAVTPSDPHAAALTAYRGMWAAYSEAVQAPDPASPVLAKYASGEALKVLVTGLTSVKSQGLKGRGAVLTSPVITGAKPPDAPTVLSVRDCTDTTGTSLVRATPGKPYADTQGGRRLCLAEVRKLADGSWRVTSFGVHEVGSC